MKYYTNSYALLVENNTNTDYTIKPSQGDGWKITTQYGYIDYKHNAEDLINEIWWVESHKKGHGSELVDLMQRHHPADSIAWGATSIAGEKLMDKWHRNNPNIQCITGDHEGQFNPFDHDDNYDEEDD